MKKIILIILVTNFLNAFCSISSYTIDSDTVKVTSLFSPPSNQNVGCYRIPVIATAPNGDLIAAIDQRVPSCGDLKWNQDINIVIRRSTDMGKTWSNLETIVDYPFGESASDPSIIVDAMKNTIFLFFNYMNHKSEPNIYYFRVIKSFDNGKTWSTPQDITSQISKPEWTNNFKFITSGNGIQTHSGTLLHTIVNLENGLYVFGSSDHGLTWFLIDTKIFPGDESKIVELPDGKWMINSRVNGLGYRYIHISDNDGKIWTSKVDSSLIDPGCNGSILSYSYFYKGENKNMLVFANPKSSTDRKNLTIRVSKDDGQTWSDGKTIYAGSSAYSSICILKNGEIGLLFEIDDYSDNVFASFSMEYIDNELNSSQNFQDKAFKLTDTNVHKGDSCYVFPLYALCHGPVCPETLKLCDSIALFLINNPSVIIEIQSHTDCRDIALKNDTLTFRRVLQLKNLILEKYPIDPNRIQLKGCGERYPRVVNEEIHQKFPFLPVGQILDETFIDTIKNKDELEEAHDLNRRTLIIVK